MKISKRLWNRMIREIIIANQMNRGLTYTPWVRARLKEAYDPTPNNG